MYIMGNDDDDENEPMLTPFQKAKMHFRKMEEEQSQPSSTQQSSVSSSSTSLPLSRSGDRSRQRSMGNLYTQQSGVSQQPDATSSRTGLPKSVSHDSVTVQSAIRQLKLGSQFNTNSSGDSSSSGSNINTNNKTNYAIDPFSDEFAVSASNTSASNSRNSLRVKTSSQFSLNNSKDGLDDSGNRVYQRKVNNTMSSSSGDSINKPSLPPRPNNDSSPMATNTSQSSSSRNIINRPPLPARPKISSTEFLNIVSLPSSAASSPLVAGSGQYVFDLNSGQQPGVMSSQAASNVSNKSSGVTQSYKSSLEKTAAYPDAFNANRKAPYVRTPSCIKELSVKGSPYRAAIGRGYLAVGSQTLKLYNLQTGDLAFTVQLNVQSSSSSNQSSSLGSSSNQSSSSSQSKQQESAKCSALCFATVPILPGHSGSQLNAWDTEYRYLWVGARDGEVYIVDVFSGEIVERRSSAHSHAITFIERVVFTSSGNNNQNCGMLTIDDNGVAQLWTEPHPSSVQLFNIPALQAAATATSQSSAKTIHIGKIISLEGRPKTIRIAPKQVGVCIVQSQNSDSLQFQTQLWTIKDRSIEIVPLSTANAHQFSRDSMSRRVDVPQTVGALTCISSPQQTYQLLHSSSSVQHTMLSRVYTGHIDGKILEWSTSNSEQQQQAAIRLIDMGSYRISALLNTIDGHLWVGTGTGRCSILDLSTTTQQDSGQFSVTCLKDWIASHGHAVESFEVDFDSLIRGDSLLVSSCSKDGHVQFYDGLLSQDYEDMFVRMREQQFCTYTPLSLLMCSWNIDANKPDALEVRGEDAYFLDKYVNQVEGGADIIVFGFQEIVDLESTKVAAGGFFSRASGKKATADQVQSMSAEEASQQASRATAWKDRLVRLLRQNYKRPYHLLECKNLVGLFTCIFVREDLYAQNLISNVSCSLISTGLGGTFGNKGGIVVRFVLDHSSFCFVNAHLPAHQNKVAKRNVDALTIVKSSTLGELKSKAGQSLDLCLSHGGNGCQALDHEFCFFAGDLNYRIDMDRDKVVQLINDGQLEELKLHDQLLRQKKQSSTASLLKIFDEGVISFAPTYKYDPGTDIYDTSEKKRVPAWCDRILFRDSISQMSKVRPDVSCRMHNQESKIRQEKYGRLECWISDHRPIYSTFNVHYRSMQSVEKFNFVKLESQQYSVDRMAEVQLNCKVNWLKCRLPNNVTESDVRRVLQSCNGDLGEVLRKFEQ
ncbi:hypothetical protein MP228_004628 [Amoeboaphelidium protococcarum]|nr:hypothetical protein MP228_004628 [Amoeboaphelidium protococcarum]